MLLRSVYDLSSYPNMWSTSLGMYEKNTCASGIALRGAAFFFFFFLSMSPFMLGFSASSLPLRAMLFNSSDKNRHTRFSL